MSPIEQIALASQALIRVAALIARPRLWVPVAAFAAVELGVVAALWQFAHPTLSWATVPLLRRLGGERVLHYPDALLELPRIHARIELLVWVIAGSIAWGASTLLFAAQFRRETPAPGGALLAALRRGPALILAQLPTAILGLAAAFALHAVLRPAPTGGVRALAFAAATFAVAGVLRGAFLHLPAVVMIEGRGALDGWRDLPRLWSRGLWGASFLAFASMLPLIPVQVLAARGGELAARHGPEAMVGLAAVHVALAALAAFLLWGAATLTYLGGVMEFDEWDAS